MGSFVAASGQLNAAIGAPKRTQYQTIRDGKDWRNPIITIQDDGVNVKAKGIAGIKHIPVTELKRLLISLLGLGTFAVQLARQYGAHVTAVCGPENANLVTSLGADAVIDYTKEDFTRDGPI